MIERVPIRQRGRLAVALAALAVLPGCLTAELWRDYSWPAPVVTDQFVERRTTERVGTLTVSPPALDNGLWWCGDQAHERWWLGPRIDASASAEFAAALLADAEFCRVHAASIDAWRSCVGDEVLRDEARLQLQLSLRTEAIGEVMPAAAVHPAAARVLATGRRNAYVLTADPGANLPPVCRQCAERLTAVDLRGLVGKPVEQGDVHVEAWVFVDAQGRPAFRTGEQTVTLPEAANEESAPLADRLTALQTVSLLVRVRHGQDSTILRLRPDRLWLLSGLRADGDRFAHDSRWHLQRTPMYLATPPTADAARLPSTLRLQQDAYQRSVRPVLLDGELLAKIALTPVTLAFDVVLGPGAGDFLRWITGASIEPRDRPQRRS